MKIIGIILIVLGIISFILALAMFGDIGIAAMIGASSALLSGIGFILTDKTLKNNSK